MERTTTLSRYCVHQHHKALSLSCSSHSGGGHTTTESQEPSCHVQNPDGDSDGAITGMIRGKWSGWSGIVEQALCGWRVWAAALPLGGRPNRLRGPLGF